MNSHILRQFGLGILLVSGVPLWSQVNTAPETPAPPPTVEDRMQTPPTVSGAAYPTTYTSEERSNYLRAGLSFNTSYSDNVLGGTTSNPVSDVSYSIWPSIALDQKRPRLRWVLSYSPGFTFYQRVSSRNQDNQNVSTDFSYRLSPHVTLSLHDSFQKSSSLLNQPDLASNSPVTGGTQGVVTTVVAPLADQLTNNGNVEVTYQFSANAMIGASGTFTNLHYLNQAQVPGLFDSSSQGGSVFYNHRLAKKHYLGVTYQYQRIAAYPVGAQSETQTNAVLALYTFYPQPGLSLSVSAGPQRSQIDQSPLPSSQSWSPAVTASIGWQARHTNLAAGYSRIVSGGGGLLGAFHSSNANLSLKQQLSRNWNALASGAYSINKTLTPLFFQSTPGGHSISGSVSIQRTLGPHLSAEAGYARLYQTYSNIAAITTAPNTNREWVSVSYQFARPLGR